MADLVGEQFGNFQLNRLLHTGRFADVYLAEHLTHKTPAAVKLLHVLLTGQDVQEFLAEAQSIANLKHNHIVRLLKAGVKGGMPYLGMHYVSHGTLRTRYPRGSKLQLETVITYARQAAEALAYAHERGVIHQDLKPENLFFTSRSEVMVSDFGIAMRSRGALSFTNRAASSTAEYMAPEQVQGQATPATDQYALAAIVYEWLTGAPPFTGSFSEVVAKQGASSPPSLREQLPNLPPRVEEVILTALAKDPTFRFASIRDFIQALERANVAPLAAPAELPPTERVNAPPAAPAPLASANYPQIPPNAPELAATERAQTPPAVQQAPLPPAPPPAVPPFAPPELAATERAQMPPVAQNAPPVAPVPAQVYSPALAPALPEPAPYMAPPAPSPYGLVEQSPLPYAPPASPAPGAATMWGAPPAGMGGDQGPLLPPPPPLPPPVSPAYPGVFGGVTPGGTAVQPPGVMPPPMAVPMAPSPAPPWPGGFQSSPSQPPNSGMKKAVLFVLAAVIVAVAIIGGAYLVSHTSSSSSPQASATATPTATATPATGPNGSPPDAASFTIQEQSPYQEVLTVKQGAVCGSFDDGKKHQVGRGTQSDGSTYVETMIAQCDPQHSTYHQGTLSYVEAAVYFEVDFFTASGQPSDVCATPSGTSPFAVQELQGTLSSSSAVTGPFQAPQSPNLDCAAGGSVYLKAQNGTWQGIVSR